MGEMNEAEQAKLGTFTKVKGASGDTTPDYLQAKITSSNSSVQFTKNDSGSDETLSLSASGIDEKVKATTGDSSAGYLADKLTSGVSSITVTPSSQKLAIYNSPAQSRLYLAALSNGHIGRWPLTTNITDYSAFGNYGWAGWTQASANSWLPNDTRGLVNNCTYCSDQTSGKYLYSNVNTGVGGWSTKAVLRGTYNDNWMVSAWIYLNAYPSTDTTVFMLNAATAPSLDPTITMYLSATSVAGRFRGTWNSTYYTYDVAISRYYVPLREWTLIQLWKAGANLFLGVNSVIVKSVGMVNSSVIVMPAAQYIIGTVDNVQANLCIQDVRVIERPDYVNSAQMYWSAMGGSRRLCTYDGSF